MIDTNQRTEELGTERPVDLGIERDPQTVSTEKVSPRDIFKLAKGVLISTASIYVLLCAARIFYSGNEEGLKEVWGHGNFFLSNVITLVLGLYFGREVK